MSYPGSGRADYFALGDWNVVCYQCGRKRKASTLVKHWQGYYVCKEHWETRQPQDFVRSVPDVQTPPWAQPMPGAIFRTYCTFEGSTGIAGFAVAGCAISGKLYGGRGSPVPPTYPNVLFNWSNTIFARVGASSSVTFRVDSSALLTYDSLLLEDAGIRLLEDASARSLEHTSPIEWYAPWVDGIGNSYWIKATQLSGAPRASGVLGAITSLATCPTWVMDPTGTAQLAFTIYGDAGGLTQIGVGTVTLEAS